MNKEQIVDRILSRGVIKQILPTQEEFKQKLLSEKPMKFYIGADPTGPLLHLSHAKNFMLLEEFRQLGHKVYVLFGDFTACIGDPSDRDSARSKLTREEAKANIAEWVKHISCLINFDDEDNPAEVVTNSTWFDAMSTTEMVEMLSNSTVQQMIERDMFQKRMDNNKPIFLNEFMYPMFQGYDSVALDVDVELCGTDQIFNALSGRDLLKKFRGKDKFVVAVNLMENPVTGSLMSKSNGTGVFLGTDHITMFGEVMSQPDEMIEIILINNTRVSLEDIKSLNIAEKPREAKLFTATEVVKIFHGEEKALEAKQAFIDTFSKKQFPEDAKHVQIAESSSDIFQLCKSCMPENSNSEIRRLIQQGSVSIFGQKYENQAQEVEISENMEVKIGKRGFFRIN